MWWTAKRNCRYGIWGPIPVFMWLLKPDVCREVALRLHGQMVHQSERLSVICGSACSGIPSQVVLAVCDEV